MAYESAIAIIGVGGFFGLLTLAINTNEEDHVGLKLLYTLMSLWYFVGMLNLGIGIANDNTAPSSIITTLSTLYRAVITISLLSTAWYVIYFIKYVLSGAVATFLQKRRMK